MLNAQKMIEERKKALSIPSTGMQKNINSKDKKPIITTDFEKQAKIAQLQVIYYLFEYLYIILVFSLKIVPTLFITSIKSVFKLFA